MFALCYLEMRVWEQALCCVELVRLNWQMSGWGSRNNSIINVTFLVVELRGEVTRQLQKVTVCIVFTQQKDDIIILSRHIA